MMGSRPTVPWAVLLLVFFLVPLQTPSTEAPERITPDETMLPTPLRCPVDGDIVETREHGVMWQGRRYYMESEACVQMFLADPETFAKRIEPRAALFSAPRTDQPSYNPWVLFLSLFVVAGLVSGAVTSYVAVQKGLGGRNWFLLGLLLNGVAVVMVFFCRGREMLFQAKGLSKTPQTHQPVVCPHCDNANHPSAARCSGCGTGLAPKVQSDVARAS